MFGFLKLRTVLKIVQLFMELGFFTLYPYLVSKFKILLLDCFAIRGQSPWWKIDLMVSKLLMVSKFRAAPWFLVQQGTELTAAVFPVSFWRWI